MSARGNLERLLAKDQLIVLCVISTVVVFAGLYTVWGGRHADVRPSNDRDGKTHRRADGHGAGAGLVGPASLVQFFMWWSMMIAMMTPSAAPTLLLFASLKRNAANGPQSLWFAWLFLARYLTIWAVFSAIKVLLQWWL